MHFLLTWNCTHIANAEVAVAIAKACQAQSSHKVVSFLPKDPKEA